MILFAGLGNPGEKYARNRHNIGFMAVDEIARRHGFTPWREKFHGLISDGRLGAEKVLLLKPQTFMNESGQSVAAAAHFYKIPNEDVVVFHDELDLGHGIVKVKSGGGHAGHNGLRSIDAHISRDFRRVRLGIGHPGQKDLVTNWVLGNFARSDHEWLDPLLAHIADGAAELAAGKDSQFIQFLHQAGQSTKPAKAKKAEPPPPELPKGAPQKDEPTKGGALADGLKKLFGFKRD